MQQNQCVQTSSFELAFQLQDLIYRETKIKSPSLQYNFSTSKKTISNSKQIKQINSHRSVGEINSNISSPPPKKLLGKPVEGRALLANLMFPSQAKMKVSIIEQNKEKKDQPTQKNIHMARRLSQYNQNESKSSKQFEWINKFNLQLQKCNYYVNNEKSVKLKTQRKRQLSVLDDVLPISSRNLFVNGTQSQFSSRVKTPNKK
ncbi:unnamed protein product [Paramecium pentaurelia]|uniref:Uncharacterized protein n=1 Tax=Paramecium pentaurelia TaxID=43138 RepID=A0A8S1S6R8_9CILI|nr:unnamed protein product [Paramecium pentaurelia]